MTPDKPTPGAGEDSCSADVAAYTLGALEPTEAESFRHHLETCSVCPVELRAFQQVVDDLAIGVPNIKPSPELKRRVIGSIEREPRTAPGTRQTARARATRERRRDAAPRRSTWLHGPKLALGAGIAFALAAVVVVITALPGRQNGRTVRASTTVGGSAALHISPHRTELVVRHIGAPSRGKVYEVWLQYGKHTPRPNALFGVDREGDASVELPGSMYGVRHVMVTAEPAPRGTRTPTAAPVISASLS